MAGVKFATRMFLPTAVLVLLSVSTSAEDSKRCYWCGPLAEQVHRSQRAPSCGQELQETMCDPGYTHCAVVATSPPYIESRLCVKFYQDECYSLYCNTSKTWRMICPCQGNLCNGQNTDRENRAFATLTKIVGKNKREKRCSVGAKGFLSLTPRKKAVDEDTTTMAPDTDTHSSIPSEEPMDNESGMMQTTNVINVLENEIINDVGEIIEEVKQSEQDSESEMQGDQPIEMNEATTEATNVETANVERDTKTIDDIKINQVSSTISMLEENTDVYTTASQELVEETKEGIEIPTLTSMVPTSIQIELSVIQMKNPKDNLPPPEALQQNVTPAKVTATTTMGTTEMITNTNHIETTTHSIKETTKKNDQKTEKKKKGDSEDTDEKNGEVPNLADLWELVIIMNVLIYLV